MVAARAEPSRMPTVRPDLEANLVRRPWTRAERRIVVNGLLGRLVIACEPLICCFVFGGLTAALIFLHLPSASHLTHWEAAIVLAPIFGLATLAFSAYAVVLLVAPLRALRQTFQPIYVVDGYVRYRSPDTQSECDSSGYIAVLDEDRRLIVEWPGQGEGMLLHDVRPALVEFSSFGGIHRIDGRSTGVLPEHLGPLGVGAR
jgi:hypothetical protein